MMSNLPHTEKAEQLSNASSIPQQTAKKSLRPDITRLLGRARNLSLKRLVKKRESSSLPPRRDSQSDLFRNPSVHYPHIEDVHAIIHCREDEAIFG